MIFIRFFVLMLITCSLTGAGWTMGQYFSYGRSASVVPGPEVETDSENPNNELDQIFKKPTTKKDMKKGHSLYGRFFGKKKPSDKDNFQQNANANKQEISESINTGAYVDSIVDNVDINPRSGLAAPTNSLAGSPRSAHSNDSNASTLPTEEEERITEERNKSLKNTKISIKDDAFDCLLFTNKNRCNNIKNKDKCIWNNLLERCDFNCSSIKDINTCRQMISFGGTYNENNILYFYDGKQLLYTKINHKDKNSIQFLYDYITQHIPTDFNCKFNYNEKKCVPLRPEYYTSDPIDLDDQDKRRELNYYLRKYGL